MANKRKKKFFSNINGGGDNERKDKMKKRQSLEVGMRGFVVSSNVYMGKAIFEVYDFLDDYFRQNGGQVNEIDQSETDRHVDNFESCSKQALSIDENDDDHLDFEQAIRQESKRLKCENTTKRFQAVQVSCGRHLAFISSNHNDEPSSIAWEILNNIKQTGTLKGRYVARFLPVDFTFKGWPKDFEAACEKMAMQIKKHNETCKANKEDKYESYAVVCESKFNPQLTGEFMKRQMADVMLALNPTMKVNLTRPQRVILIQILARVGCMALVKDYFELRKYNVHEVAKLTKVADSTTTATASVTTGSFDDKNNPCPKGNDEQPRCGVLKNDKFTDDKKSEDELRTINKEAG